MSYEAIPRAERAFLVPAIGQSAAEVAEHHRLLHQVLTGARLRCAYCDTDRREPGPGSCATCGADVPWPPAPWPGRAVASEAEPWPWWLVDLVCLSPILAVCGLIGICWLMQWIRAVLP